MRIPRFSIRFLLAGMAIAAGILLAILRFGPHVVWVATMSGAPIVHSSAPIPLVATPLDEELNDCRVGAFAFQLPTSMCQAVEVQRGPWGVRVRFSDGKRTLLVNLNPGNDFVWFPNGFPEKKFVTSTELTRQMAKVQSSDFSFAMTPHDLRWHEFCLKNRIETTKSIEHRKTTDLDANLLWLSSILLNYEWATTDGKWYGGLMFQIPSGEADWVRNVCLSFVVNGDPTLINTSDDAAIESMVATILAAAKYPCRYGTIRIRG